MPASHLPTHIAFIMDGNGRWATKRGLGRLKGHSEGAETVRRVCEELIKLGITHATFYAFSTENWQRPQEEVSGLFTLMRTYFRSELKTIIEKGMRVHFIGDRSEQGGLEPDIRALMEEVEAKTAHNTKLHATFAVNYGAQDEITRAARTLAEQAAAGTLKPEEITTQLFAQSLDTATTPPPDFVIRTSGEQRLSNFLLWQLAYAELYFSDVAWPDFGPTHLQAALASYTARTRRFGQAPAVSAA